MTQMKELATPVKLLFTHFLLYLGAIAVASLPCTIAERDAHFEAVRLYPMFEARATNLARAGCDVVVISRSHI